ncbi:MULTISPECIES: hypothetical protein [Flavobacterium]|uniref:hypothetical protein n=1 Tax=Flavobacterium TaxID=237 RepID=UPI001FCB0562|nr:MULTISPECIES: hypothetical protein [Flavobacterium]UOK41245.1 hypothetical protein LZF87_07890 [Flavobacterium enshiense]
MKTIHYKIIFFSILIFYCLVFSQFGMENWDTGYIPSFSWRVINGQDIYEDFIYKGPPISIYFHAFWMKILPIEGQFYFIRIVNYLLFAIQVYFVLSAFDLIYKFKNYGINKWALMIACFVISIHNFPPYPWPTTDGLLFASIAFWIMAKDKSDSFIHLALIAFFSLVSALTKQSFYLIPIGFLACIFIKSGIKKSFQFGLLLLFFVGIFLLWISSFTTISNYLEQTSNQTSFTDLYKSGVDNYIHCIRNKWIMLCTILIPILPSYFLRKINSNALQEYLKWLIISFSIVSVLYHLFQNERQASLIFYITCALSIVYYYFFIQKDIKFIAPILLVLLIAWSTAISVGYPFTMLFSTGMIASFIILFQQEIPKFRYNKVLYYSIIIGVSFISFASNRNPYRDSSLEKLNYSLETISLKLKYIKTDKETFEKHNEIKKLIKKYGKNFIVAPGTPMANYVFGSQSKLPADWIITNEVMGREALFIKLASNKKNYIFIEKEYIIDKPYINYKILYSGITSFIYENFNKIDETKHYLVYNSLQDDKKLP